MSPSAIKNRPEPPAMGANGYDEDFCAWVGEQVALLRAGRFGEIDAENIAEELSDVGKSEYAKLDSVLRVLLMHMLKSDQQPELRTPSWVYSIDEQRRRYLKLIRKNPSLKAYRDEALADIYSIARNWAASETHFDVSEFPSECPYTWADIIERPFEHDQRR
jgi:hypothetical protein